MQKCLSAEDAAALVPDGAKIMIGGFLGCGTPHRVIDALLDAGASNLTLIANDTDRANTGIGKLIHERRVSRLVATHIGLNPETQQGLLEGGLEVDLVPQGTLAEQIRAGGYGLGGVLTKTGLGTVAARAGQTMTINGEEWLYMPPLRADFALIYADRADQAGNLAYQLTQHNFNPLMAMAGETVICEAREIVPVGVIAPDHVKTPGVIVDYLVGSA